MNRCSHAWIFAAVSILWCGVSASAETLRCQSINGNLNCSGSGGAACQTVDGKTVCSSGHGDVVQSFGGGTSSHDDATNDDSGGSDEDTDDVPPASAKKLRLEQRGPSGHALQIQRDGTRLHIHNDWISIDRN
jgi:hypothetical protein